VPVYEYECTECGERLEVRQSFTDDPLTECPVCSGRLRKVLSPVGVVFKGSGFYRTDSRRAEGTPGDKGDKSGKGDKKPADGGSGDAKPAASGSGSSSGASDGSGSGSSGSDGSSSNSKAKPKKAATGS
jgi:putative FmdB family regulatory protein